MWDSLTRKGLATPTTAINQIEYGQGAGYGSLSAMDSTFLFRKNAPGAVKEGCGLGYGKVTIAARAVSGLGIKFFDK